MVVYGPIKILWHYLMRQSLFCYISRIAGGTATPTAWNIFPQLPLHSVRTEKRLSFSSIRTCCRAFRSWMMSVHSKTYPAAFKRRSSSFFRIKARKLQNTWPLIVVSHWWKTGRVSSSDLISRKTRSTCHSSLYLRAAWSAGKSVFVCRTHCRQSGILP